MRIKNFDKMKNEELLQEAKEKGENTQANMKKFRTKTRSK